MRENTQRSAFTRVPFFEAIFSHTSKFFKIDKFEAVQKRNFCTGQCVRFCPGGQAFKIFWVGKKNIRTAKVRARHRVLSKRSPC